MSATTAEPKAKRPPTPGSLKKQTLTLPQAADQWERTEAALEKLTVRVKTLEAERDDAAEILLAHFTKTGNAAYKGRIGWMWTSTRLILDQPKVTKFLGKQLRKFQKRTESKRKLTRLTPPD